MDTDRNMPTYEELFYQQQQELMLRLQPVSTTSNQPQYTYHPSYYTHDVKPFLIETSYQFGSHSVH
jgi:hypothetical protein